MMVRSFSKSNSMRAENIGLMILCNSTWEEKKKKKKKKRIHFQHVN